MHKTLAAMAALAAAAIVSGQETQPPIPIHRAEGTITLDGAIDDPGWQGATRIDTFWETNPGDNVAPSVETVAWAAYDEKFLYAAFRCDDPEPARIRAPFADRDNVASDTDYAGIILDTRH